MHQVEAHLTNVRYNSLFLGGGYLNKAIISAWVTTIIPADYYSINN